MKIRESKDNNHCVPCFTGRSEANRICHFPDRYYIAKSLDCEIYVTGNSWIHRAVYDRLTEVLTELRCVEAGQYIDEELTDDVKLLAAVIDSLYALFQYLFCLFSNFP